MRRDARRDLVADQWRRIFDAEPVDRYVAMIEHRGRQLAPGLDVVTADPPQRLAQQRRRQVAAAQRDRSGGKRRADEPDRRLSMRARNQFRKVGPSAHGWTLTAALA